MHTFDRNIGASSVFYSSRSHLRTGSTSSGSSCGMFLLCIIVDSSTALGLNVSVATVAVVLRKLLEGTQVQRALDAAGRILDDTIAVRASIRSILTE